MHSLLRKRVDPRKARACFWCALSLLCLYSCSNPPTESPPPPKITHVEQKLPPSVKPEEQLYEQLRSGSFQLDAAAGSIEDTLEAAKSAHKALAKYAEAASAMQDVIEYLDSAGEGVAEFGDGTPNKEDVAKNFAASDDKRLKAIEAANDALHDLREALGILESLSGSENDTVAKKALSVKALVAVAIDDVWGAIEAFGGEPEANNAPLNP
jgi:hypothetical protein